MSPQLSSPVMCAVLRCSGTQRRGGDVEAAGGGQKDAELDNLDVDKKGEAGVNPAVNAVLVHVWTAMRTVCPAALQYVGDKPPRIGPVGLGLIAYVFLLHLYLLLFTHCAACPPAAAAAAAAAAGKAKQS